MTYKLTAIVGLFLTLSMVSSGHAQSPASASPADLPRGMTQDEAKARLEPSQKLVLETDQKPLIAYYKALPVRWQRFPGPDDLARYFPKVARKDEVRGVVLAQCDWDAKGAITDCRIIEEKPAQYGFGEATKALLMATGTVALKPEQSGELAAGVGLPVILRWELGY